MSMCEDNIPFTHTTLVFTWGRSSWSIETEPTSFSMTKIYINSKRAGLNSVNSIRTGTQFVSVHEIVTFRPCGSFRIRFNKVVFPLWKINHVTQAKYMHEGIVYFNKKRENKLLFQWQYLPRNPVRTVIGMRSISLTPLPSYKSYIVTRIYFWIVETAWKRLRPTFDFSSIRLVLMACAVNAKIFARKKVPAKDMFTRSVIRTVVWR